MLQNLVWNQNESKINVKQHCEMKFKMEINVFCFFINLSRIFLGIYWIAKIFFYFLKSHCPQCEKRRWQRGRKIMFSLLLLEEHWTQGQNMNYNHNNNKKKVHKTSIACEWFSVWTISFSLFSFLFFVVLLYFLIYAPASLCGSLPECGLFVNEVFMLQYEICT